MRNPRTRFNSLDIPKWKKASLASKINKKKLTELKRFSQKLQRFLRSLDKLFLNFNNLLKALDFFNLVFTNFFDAVIRDLAFIFIKLLRDVRSTGVYLLDLTTPNYIGDTFGIPDHLLCSYEIDPETGKFKISLDEKYDFFDYFLAAIKDIFTKYRPTTYFEWLDICFQAFADVNDKPSNIFFRKTYESQENKIIENLSPAEKQKIFFTKIKDFLNDYLRPGVPMFSENVKVNCILIHFSAPNVWEFLELMKIFYYFFYGRLETYYEDFMKAAEFVKENFDFTDRGITISEENFKKIVTKAYNTLFKTGFDNFISAIDSSINLKGEENPHKVNAVRNYPDFVGVSIYQILPGFFDSLEELTNKLINTTESIGESYLDMLRKIISKIRTKIKDLIDLIRLIDQIIAFLNSLIYLSYFNILEIKNASGTIDLLEKIAAAEPPVENPDEPALHGGILILWAYTDKKTFISYKNNFSSFLEANKLNENFNFKDYFYERMKELNGDPQTNIDRIIQSWLNLKDSSKEVGSSFKDIFK